MWFWHHSTTLFWPIAVLILYTIVTHPLRKFPGPFLCSVSNLPFSIWFNSGRKEFTIHALHDKYGPVVRIAPNELSFNTAQSWKDIYGFRTGHQSFLKSEWNEGVSFADQGVHGVISSRDPKEHAHMRRYLSHAFSAQALKEQEVLVHEIVDMLVRRIREIGVEKGEVMDLERWLRMCTFDITGSLVLGRSFDAVKDGGQHPSVKFIHEALQQMKVVDTMKRLPILGKLLALLSLRALMKVMHANTAHEQFCINIIKERLSNPSARPDFLTRLQDVHNEESDKPVDIQLAAHSSELLVAGSDTSNTTLVTLLNFVLRDTSIYNQLCTQIRTKFSTYEAINAQDAASIPFIRPLILEAMRIYPPVPFGLPRTVPSSGDTVDGCFIPGGTTVSTNALSAALSEKNFVRPLEYIPARWEKSAAEHSTDSLEASQPFSLGSRGCLGQNLAWVEMNLILCKLIWSFDLELVNKDMDLHRDSKTNILWESPPLHIRVTDRRR
ncbi:cytochrome P450 [Lophiotrema nucula]|uniref:Cytochrome P450 n=1 Tax=Lophiotrema nucula TaxID=690887 RepID=A0A6A5ZGG9_9PLEO|nr:cytochrome P450 [Lophiotrema nucula]